MLNLFTSNIPTDWEEEDFLTLYQNSSVKIERIISNGHTTAEGQWYDQAQDEWVVVIEGSATIMYDDQRTVSLVPGDTLLIPAHKKHRVISTATDKKTIWLAVHCCS